jgi:RNA polymerase sigma-70 factor (ECF subfamily)
MSEDTDETLMKAYALGDEQGFRTLYSRYEKRLSNFLNQRLSRSHTHLKNDLFQITWLKVHQARKSFDEKQKFSAWLFTIALNSLRDQTREKWSRDRMELNDTFASSEDGIDEQVIAQEIFTKLKEQLDILPSLQRDVLLLSDSEGFQSKEIAAILKITDGSVRQILFRARARLRTSMKEIYGS